ncbi:hypothetical protein C8Q75DRAFT_808125 [Abortiporus biennis]|nr:hypothetical protein C8Q75DRAFT_808125 [Abortiporus biennis]
MYTTIFIAFLLSTVVHFTVGAPALVKRVESDSVDGPVSDLTKLIGFGAFYVDAGDEENQ